MFVSCDAKALEWRLAVDYSADKVGIAELNTPGADVHKNNQEEFRLPERRDAKFFLFRTIFRGDGWSFANDPLFAHISRDPKYWDEKNAMFYRKYKNLDNLHLKWAQSVQRTRKITGFTGQTWEFQMKQRINKRTGEITEELPWSDFTNWPIQGTGNVIVSIARINLWKRLTAEKIRAILVSTVHDSIVSDTEEPERVAKLMYEVFDAIPADIKRIFGYTTNVQYPCEVKAGKNLKEMTLIEQNY